MSFWKIVTLTFTASIIVEAITLGQNDEHPPILCSTNYNNTNKVQCFCATDNTRPPPLRTANCFLTVQNVLDDDPVWNTFKALDNFDKISFASTRGIPLAYIPTQALKETPNLSTISIKYGTMSTVGAFAFANLSSLNDIILRGNQIETLDPYAFIHHKNLTYLSLDRNNIAEINRNVFVDLPALERMFLTGNKINTIHDRAFIHLVNLRELEIDRNNVFSLNFAVFEGLQNLEKLDLSSNSLEVIGDNTFYALPNLKSLNLDGNNIQMLDEKAFNGLGNVISLSLAHNKLNYIDSDKVFEALSLLLSLNLKGNKLKELKRSTMEPIMSNFYGLKGSLDVEDNDLSCVCNLEWFMSLMNETQNTSLKRVIQNLKCRPDDKLRETWNKYNEKIIQLEEEIAQEKGGDYEYYDDTQLNGTLFYSDVRYLLNCSTTDVAVSTAAVSSTVSTTTAIEANSNDPALVTENTNTNKKDNIVGTNQGAFTTTRLATVSAKPEETKIYEKMASDEAKPEKGKAHRSIQEESKYPASFEDSKTNNADKNVGCVSLLVSTLLYLRFNI